MQTDDYGDVRNVRWLSYGDKPRPMWRRLLSDTLFWGILTVGFVNMGVGVAALTYHFLG